MTEPLEPGAASSPPQPFPPPADFDHWFQSRLSYPEAKRRVGAGNDFRNIAIATFETAELAEQAVREHNSHAALLAAIRRCDDAIEAIRKAFGAPGGYGYETAEGKALYALYQAGAGNAYALKSAAP